MPRLILFDEFHIVLLVPPTLPEAEAAACQRVLDSRRFHRQLGRAVREVVRHFRALRKVRVRVAR